MPEMNFGDFLDKMSGKRPQSKPQKPRRIVEEETSKKQKREEPKEKPQNKEPEREPKREEETMAKENTSSDDDIVIKALDYSKRFIKVIYDNFKNKNDRRIVLQSIRTAIDLALGDNQVQYSQQPVRKTNTNVAKQDSVNTEKATKDENIDIHMNDLSGQQFDASQQQYFDESEGYNRNLNLDVRVGSDGKREVDLSKVSQKEMNEMRVLAGIGENQDG